MNRKKASKRWEGAGPRMLAVNDEWAILTSALGSSRGAFLFIEAAGSEEAQALATDPTRELAILHPCFTPYGGTEGLTVVREIPHPFANVIVMSGIEGTDIEETAWHCSPGFDAGRPESPPGVARLALRLMGRGNG